MSYYRPSFVHTTGGGMSRGGRGSFSSSRGSSSYRGGPRGSSSWNSSGSRGYHGTGSRGGGTSASYRSSGYSGGSFDTSRSLGKYGGERIPSFRGSSGGEESYRKPSYRPDTGYARESRMSPERKRMRTESRHDVYSSGGDSSMSSRYSADNSFTGRSKQSLTSSTPFHRPSSSAGGGGGGSDFRKPLAPPPPPNISNSYSSGPSTRSGYRGGRISSRSGSRYIVSGRDTSFRAAPRRLMDYSTSTTTWRSSRGGVSIRSSEYARRLRLRQLTNRSAIIRSTRPIHSSRIKRNDSDDELWGAVRDDDDEDEEEDNDEDIEDSIEKEPKESHKENKSAKKVEVDDEVKKIDKKDADDGEDDDKDDDDEDEDNEEKGDQKKGDADGEGETTVKKKSPTKKVSSSKDRERENSPEDSFNPRKQFIKLVCPYCHTRCITFSRYTNHLRSARHSAAMHHVALKQKTVLSRMRIAQRAEQKAIERSMDETDLTAHTNFCPLCKLNYRQTKLIHRASKAHRDMKRFLMPVCKTCGITCKSPMLYETHCCSLEHIKRKAYSTTNGDKSDKSEHSGEDLQNYMTIDSVGEMDDIDMELPPPPSVADVKEATDGEKSEGEIKPTKVRTDKEKHSSSSKREREPQINVGVENIRKIEVHYCDLCRMYLPRVEDVHDDLDRILAKHCKQRTHMQRYIRYKEDKDLAKRAERLQRREMAEKEKEKDSKKTTTASKDDAANKSTNNTDVSATKADKHKSSSGDNEESTASSQSHIESGDAAAAAAALKDSTAETEEDDEEEKLLEDVDVKEIQEADAEAEAGDDKLWEDVDKDLGDILAGENKSCGDEEEEDDDSMVNGERYDRFKYSEKNAKSGNVGKSQPTAAKKTEAGSSAAEKNQVEGEIVK